MQTYGSSQEHFANVPGDAVNQGYCPPVKNIKEHGAGIPAALPELFGGFIIGAIFG